DDPPVFAAGHAVEHRLGHVEAAAEIDVHHLVPLRPAHLADGGVAGDAGVVDQHINRPEVGLDLAHAVLARVEIGDVPPVGGDAGTIGELARPLLIPGVIGCDIHPHVAKGNADRLADAARSASD